MNHPSPAVRAVLFDLDDTLFLQRDWLYGAWRSVAATAELQGIDPRVLVPALEAIAAEGTAAGGIIDRAVAAVGAPGADVAPLVEAFRSHRPDRLPPLDGVPAALAALRAVIPLGLVTDGDTAIQSAKIAALGLEDAFDCVVLSDALGRDRRKPHPAPFEAALAHLGCDPTHAVYIGDNPAKDVVGAARLGLTPVRVRTGEYAAVTSPVPTREFTDVLGAIDHVWRLLPVGVTR